ncbi:hypothetical protein [Actinomadura keratinilytica]|uniref:hypothetical protein n=1 Tax=Actinomadura keratinilytica TaxID=547461 RepID=UPI003617541E
MTPVLRSYSHDTWQEGGGPARPLRDAATGEVVARLPATGPDPAAMLDHARRVGGPRCAPSPSPSAPPSSRRWPGTSATTPPSSPS